MCIFMLMYTVKHTLSHTPTPNTYLVYLTCTAPNAIPYTICYIIQALHIRHLRDRHRVLRRLHAQQLLRL